MHAFIPTLALAAALAATPAFAQRTTGEAQCLPAETEGHHRCEIRLGTEEAPLEAAEFTISTAMPSMPMAHNMAPVAGSATDTPGLYVAEIPFGMPGDWTLTLDLTAPERDRIVLPVEIAPAN